MTELRQIRQIPLAIGPAPLFTFDNFRSGANAAALAHLQALGPGAPPVLIWGPRGSGKTHLLHAVAQRWQASGHQVGWYGASVPAPWQAPLQASLLVLDDCHAFDASQQHAAFALFVQAASAGMAVLASANAPAVDLALREDLRTRLGWGPTFALAPLTEPEVRATLRQEADRRGILFGDEVLDYVLHRCARDLKHLMALLARLDEFGLSLKRNITVPLLRQMLADPEPLASPNIPPQAHANAPESSA